MGCSRFFFQNQSKSENTDHFGRRLPRLPIQEALLNAKTLKGSMSFASRYMVVTTMNSEPDLLHSVECIAFDNDKHEDWVGSFS